MSTEYSNPKAISDAGERIYRERYQTEFEANHVGEFVVINVKTEQAALGESPEAAIEAAQSIDPTGVFHLIRVGFSSAFQISHARTETPGPDWLFR